MRDCGQASGDSSAASMRLFLRSRRHRGTWRRRAAEPGTLCPARSATSVAGTPALSQSDTAAWRSSYGRPASGEATCSGVTARVRASAQTLLIAGGRDDVTSFAGEDPAVRHGAEGVDVRAQDRDQFGRDRHAPGFCDGPVLEPAFIMRGVAVCPAPVDFRP
jgi:hypothetical protein